MTLSFVLTTHNNAATIWQVCQQLRQTTTPGDQVLIIDAGSSDETPMLIRRFVQEWGWGDNVSSELIFSPDAPDRGLSDPQRLGHSRAACDWVIHLDGDEYVQPTKIKSLRDLLHKKDIDVILVPRGWHLAGSNSALPLPDEDRWPDVRSVALYGEGGRDAAFKLAADPRRLVRRRGDPVPNQESNLAAQWAAYDLAVSRASGIGFCPTQFLLKPALPYGLPIGRALEAITLVAGRLRQAPKNIEATGFGQFLHRIGDEMAWLSSSDIKGIIEALEVLRKALPRRLRTVAWSHPGPTGRVIAALVSGGKPAASVELLMLLATQDRARIDSLVCEVRRLRGDLDVALPGPEYLMDLYERVRRV